MHRKLSFFSNEFNLYKKDFPRCSCADKYDWDPQEDLFVDGVLLYEMFVKKKLKITSLCLKFLFFLIKKIKGIRLFLQEQKIKLYVGYFISSLTGSHWRKTFV